MFKLVTQLRKGHIPEPLGRACAALIKSVSSSCHAKSPVDTDDDDNATLLVDFQHRLDQQVRGDRQSATKGGGSTT